MAGLYIHIPFCKSRCIYCGFYSTTSLELRQRYIDVLCRELQDTKLSSIDTIYLGGGTPSQLSPQQLEQLFSYIYKRYRQTESPTAREVTIEMNPDDVTAEYAEALARLNINRVSMGAQTFDDQRLRFLNRRHTSKQVREAVSLLRQAGIQNISIDLMYGFPKETLDDWERDIDAVLSLNVEHISAYCLMIEEGTPLYEQMRNERLGTNNVNGDMRNEELERQMYELLIDKLSAAGFEHYEISNFAKPGYRSRHNSSYWNDVPYIGLGAAAHSYDGQQRFWNIANLNEYIRRIENGESPVEGSETIDGWTRYNDRVTVALRTCEGLDLSTLSDEQRQYCMKTARRFLNDGLLKLSTSHSPLTSHLSLTRSGLFVSDMIMSELMFV